LPNYRGKNNITDRIRSSKLSGERNFVVVPEQTFSIKPHGRLHLQPAVQQPPPPSSPSDKPYARAHSGWRGADCASLLDDASCVNPRHERPRELFHARFLQSRQLACAGQGQRLVVTHHRARRATTMRGWGLALPGAPALCRSACSCGQDGD